MPNQSKVMPASYCASKTKTKKASVTTDIQKLIRTIFTGMTVCKYFSLCVCHDRRFAASGAMTAEEQEQRILYTNVLEYEQDHVSLRVITIF